MNPLLDSFWRALAYCVHPRVIAMSLLPLAIMVALALGLGWFFWQPALDWAGAWVASSSVLGAVIGWLEGFGFDSLRAMLPAVIVVLLSTPVIVVVALLVVAAWMTPAMVALVARRRFPALEARRGGSLLGGVLAALGATAAALALFVLTLPLWLVPPLVLIVPPLIWGWLTYRVMSYDVLADHASAEERRELLRRRRLPLLAMGVATGYLGAAPALLWASAAVAIVLAPVIVPLAIWIYTLVFAFSSLWFAHYALAELAAMRGQTRIETP
jgi:hypothetical protein